ANTVLVAPLRVRPGKKEPSFLPFPHHISGMDTFAQSRSFLAARDSSSGRRASSSLKNDDSSQCLASLPPADFFCSASAVWPMTLGTSVLCPSPTYCLTSSPRTSAGSICWLRNSTMRLSSGGIRSATKRSLILPAWRLVLALCQNDSLS